MLEELRKDGNLKNAVLIRANLDKDTEFLTAVKAAGVNNRSTVIVFRGGKEAARSLGKISKETMLADIKSAL